MRRAMASTTGSINFFRVTAAGTGAALAVRKPTGRATTATVGTDVGLD